MTVIAIADRDLLPSDIKLSPQMSVH